jgi:hypothetical protein
MIDPGFTVQTHSSLEMHTPLQTHTMLEKTRPKSRSHGTIRSTLERSCNSRRQQPRKPLNSLPNYREETHFHVLRLLEANPQMNQRELFEALDVSLGKANYLKA